MKIWKRNAIVATVLVLICAGVYFNWNAQQNQPVDLTDYLDAEQVMATDPQTDDTVPVSGDAQDSFAQIRLSRQESRDSAVEMLQQTMANEEGSPSADQAAVTLDSLVVNALAEAQIESLIIAKGYEDCVAYMTDASISIAVAVPENGLTESDVAQISDIVTTQSDYDVSQIRIIEVK